MLFGKHVSAIKAKELVTPGRFGWASCKINPHKCYSCKICHVVVYFAGGKIRKLSIPRNYHSIPNYALHNMYGMSWYS